ncbi:TolC family protein [Pectinatus sottacetonis]|uniref:TolC family protein n=1 Tax=Pectinatus sottacetonis TaxID=1002795 RepID=UPI0018C614B9|nr:TolC family protein [Pectinatus sottacetonis]
MNKKILKELFPLAFILSLFPTSSGFCARLSLDESVQMALQNNLEIQIAAKKEDTAKYNLAGAKAKKRLTISLGSNFSISDGITDGIKKQFERDNTNSLSLNYPLYSAGKNNLNVNIQEQTLLQSSLNTQRTAENIAYNTIKAYYDILEADQDINVDKESVNNYTQHLKNVQELYSAGSIPKSDLLRSQVALSNAKQTLIKAKNTYDINVITFKNIIKLNRDEPLYLTDTFKYRAFIKPLSYCLLYAAKHRKDLEQAKIDCNIAQKNIELAKTDYKPTVNASISTDWTNQPTPTERDHDYTVGIAASWDVFDNGLTKSSINSAQSVLEQKQLALQEKADDIDLEVRQAYLNMNEAKKRFNSTQTAIDQAEEDLFIAQEKYRVGAGIILDIIDAQLALSTARLNQISAQYDYARDKAQLKNAMGISVEDNE